MENLRSAFTMVELVFVVAAIAILAALSLPKLAATRDDAKMSRLAQNSMTGAFEIASYATARGETEKNLSLMSNAISLMIEQEEAVQPDPNTPQLDINWKSQPCLILRIENQGANTETLTITADDNNTDDGCKRLQSLIDMGQFPMLLRGTHISY